MTQVFWAAYKYEVIPCHLIAPKDRDGRGKYAANSKRDKRRLQKVVEYEIKMKRID